MKNEAPTEGSREYRWAPLARHPHCYQQCLFETPTTESLLPSAMEILSTMEIGINLWVWGAPITTERIEDRVPYAKDMGFDMVEIPMVDPNEIDPDRVKQVLTENQMSAGSVVAMSEDRDLLHDDPNIRENGREYLRDCIATAGDIGIKTLGGPIYSAVGRTWQMTEAERADGVEQIVRELRPLSEFAAQRNVTLAIEPLNRFETSFLNTVEQAIEVLDRVDHPSCQLLADTFHMNIEEKSIGQAIRLANDRIAYFHACGNDRGAPGNDHIEWDDVAEALDDIGYEGPLVIESFTPEVESIANAAAIWRPLEKSQDALARDGLEFLRTKFG